MNGSESLATSQQVSVPRGAAANLLVTALNDAGESEGVLLTSPPHTLGGGAGVAGPSVAVTRGGGEVEVYWGGGAGVEERQVVWGAGHRQLLEGGVAWREVEAEAGHLLLPSGPPHPQHIFVSVRREEGSRGMEEVGCTVTPTTHLKPTLTLTDASPSTLHLGVGLGVCSVEEEELLVEEVRVQVCPPPPVPCTNSSHSSPHLTLTSLQPSTCYCLAVEVATTVGSTSLPSSSTCTYCTLPDLPPTIHTAALLPAPEEEQVLLVLHLSDFPPSSTCHLNTHSSSPLLHLPCQEVVVVSLPPAHLPTGLSVAAGVGGQVGPWSGEAHLVRPPAVPTIEGVRREGEEGEGRLSIHFSGSPASSCEGRMVEGGEEGRVVPLGAWREVPLEAPSCRLGDCSSRSPPALATCGDLTLAVR